MILVADTSAIVGLLDQGDRHHATLRALFELTGVSWVLPWAVLPEIDYLAASRLGPTVQEAFAEDLAHGAWCVDWGVERDLVRAWTLAKKYRALQLGLVDGVVLASAERLHAEAIVTLDLRHFGPVTLESGPALYPRDWASPDDSTHRRIERRPTGRLKARPGRPRSS